MPMCRVKDYYMLKGATWKTSCAGELLIECSKVCLSNLTCNLNLS